MSEQPATPMASPTPPEPFGRRFRPDIEGLRAIAVSMVVLYHAGLPLTGGFVGVDVFFVLSGFLITGLLLRERATAHTTSFAGFYARRVRRILPAATLVLIITIVASYYWLGFLRADVVAGDGQWTALFGANFRFGVENAQYDNILSKPSPLQHYWSLGVEEQFYLAWPLLFSTVASISHKARTYSALVVTLLVIIMASFVWSIVQTQQDAVWAFFSPLTRAWELAIGAILAVLAPRIQRIPRRIAPWLSWVGIIGVVSSGFLFDNASPFPGYAAALPVLSTASVVVAGTISPGSGSEILLRLPPFQLLGRLSYSLYLWHWPILTIFAQRLGEEPPLAANLTLVGLALLLAFVTYHTIENPIRRSKTLSQRPRYSLLLGAGLVVAALGLCTWQLLMN